MLPIKRFLLTALLLASLFASAQEEDVTPESPPAASATASAGTNPSGGVVNLQTTVTGNQEQPRVLYILPWQSPEASEVNFELLDPQQSAIFGHLERVELRRQLEAAGEFDASVGAR